MSHILKVADTSVKFLLLFILFRGRNSFRVLVTLLIAAETGPFPP